MPLLRIITGYTRDDYREELPEILYHGYDADAARAAAEAAPAKFIRIELIESRRGQRLRKSDPAALSTHTTPQTAPSGDETHDKSPGGALLDESSSETAPPEPPADSADDGPPFTPPEPPSESRTGKRR